MGMLKIFAVLAHVRVRQKIVNPYGIDTPFIGKTYLCEYRIKREESMKKLILAMALVVLLGVPMISYGETNKTPDEARVSGTLHLGNIDPYWLEADQPLYVLKGSKSEAKNRRC